MRRTGAASVRLRRTNVAVDLVKHYTSHGWRRIRDACCPPRSGTAKTYGDWVARHALSDLDRDGIRRRVDQWTTPTRFSIVVPASASEGGLLPGLVASLDRQLYPHWALHLCVTESDRNGVKLDSFTEADSRIHGVVCPNGDAASLANAGLRESDGEWVVLLQQPCELSEHALYLIAEAIRENPSLEMLYGDEDRVSSDGTPLSAEFKPGWNPDLLAACPYLGAMLVFRRDVIDAVGDIPEGHGSLFLWGFALRAASSLASVCRIPHVITHMPISEGLSLGGVPLYCVPEAEHEHAADLLSAYVAREGLDATVVRSEDGFPRIRYELPDPAPSVALIVPTRDRCDLLKPCIESILKVTDYDAFSVTIVDNGSTEEGTLEYLASLEADSRVSVLRHEGDFNYSAINNIAVEKVEADVVGLLNNDLFIRDSEWLREMVVQAVRPEIGAVGAKLLYPDGRIQHAGVIFGPCEFAGHSFRFCRESDRTGQHRIGRVQNYSAVTAACMLVRRELYLSVGGLDAENLAVAYNDVDFCLRLQEAGYRTLYTPYAEVEHRESATRGGENTHAKIVRALREQAFVRQHWQVIVDDDPAYNPNLTWAGESFGLAFPSRAPRPWRRRRRDARR